MYTLSKRQAIIIGVMWLIIGMSVSAVSAGSGYRGPFGFGSLPSAEEIRAVDIAVGPDGAGLPPGQGTVAEGAQLYKAQCAKCHGPTGSEGPRPRLVGGKLPVKTIGTYWPYATTLFDFIRRAMPIPKPGSLTDQEVYALTAWLLHMNKIIGANEVINAESLPQVRMPNRDGFIPDPRPDVR
jgi:cytochrome c